MSVFCPDNVCYAATAQTCLALRLALVLAEGECTQVTATDIGHKKSHGCSHQQPLVRGHQQCSQMSTGVLVPPLQSAHWGDKLWLSSPAVLDTAQTTLMSGYPQTMVVVHRQVINFIIGDAFILVIGGHLKAASCLWMQA